MLGTCKGYGECMHGEGTKIALDNVFAEIEDDMKMSKGVTSKDNVIAADGCEYWSVKFMEGDIRLNFRQVEVLDGNLLIGLEFSGHDDTRDGFG